MILEILLTGVAGFFIGCFIVWKRARQELFSEEMVFDTILVVYLFGLVASRIAFILFHFDLFGLGLLRWLLVGLYPGMSLAGGLIGGLAALWYMTRRGKLPFWHMFDSAAIAFMTATVGVMLVRLSIQLIMPVSRTVLLSKHVIDLAKTPLAQEVYVAFAALSILLLKSLYARKRAFSVGTWGVLCMYLVSVAYFAVDFLADTRVYYGWLRGEQIVIVIFVVILVLLRATYGKPPQKKSMKPQSTKSLTDLEQAFIRDEEQTKEELAKLTLEDPFTNPDHQTDNASSDTEAFEQSSHLRIESLLQSLRSKLSEIEEARSRIKSGTYGICDVCKNPIDQSRLTAMPTATVCISCEKQLEGST